MDIQKMATYGTAVAVVGTGSVVGGVTVSYTHLTLPTICSV